MSYRIWRLIVAFTVTILALELVIGFGVAQEPTKSSPPDMTPYARPAMSEDLAPLGRAPIVPPPVPFDVRIVDTVVSNTDSTLTQTDTFNDGETSIAVNAKNRHEIAISAFSGTSGGNAALWHSKDGGKIWTKEFSVPPAPGVPAIFACGGPCDQTFDYGRTNRLAGAILSGETDVYSGTTTDPTEVGDWDWFAPGGVTQKTNNNVPSSFGNADQPWLLVNLVGRRRQRNNVYVAYDDFSGAPDMRVAVARATSFLNFTVDNLTGFSTGFVNPGHRLATDPRRGTVYSLFQRRIAPGAGDSQNINYMLNRSTDGGLTWSLNGSATGIVVANADTTQPTPKFCTVNALLGGVLHAAVDRSTGDLFYVYGNRDPVTGNNRLALRRIANDGMGGVTIGPEIFVTGQVQAAIPSVAVARDGTLGVFYYTCDGFSATGFPVFTAHFTVSRDLGVTFTDLGLLTFLSSAQDNGNSRQRVLGDYMQTKALGNTFYGSFTGNGVPFGRPFANHDAIFFRASVRAARP
jgi:hypothetical protein